MSQRNQFFVLLGHQSEEGSAYPKFVKKRIVNCLLCKLFLPIGFYLYLFT